jgi:putative redox protein
MSTIRAELKDGFPINVTIGEYEYTMDVPERLGGTDTAPTPTDFFLASIVACKVFYASRFLSRRDIPLTEISASLEAEKGDSRVEKITVSMKLPDDFPAEHLSGLKRMVEACYVAASIKDPVEIELKIEE